MEKGMKRFGRRCLRRLTSGGRFVRRRAFPIVFVLSLVVAHSEGQGPAYYGSPQASLFPLLEVLNKGGVSGSLEYAGTCDSFNGRGFPQFDNLAANTGSPLETVRQMFAHNPTMQVAQDPNGTIRMVQGGIPKDILNVKIAHASFETGRPPARRPIYAAIVALASLFETPEIKRFMKDQHIKGPLFGLAIGAVPPSAPPPNVPYMSAAPLDNVTFSQALDYILKFFPGIWVYENCPKTAKRDRTVVIGFYRLQKTGAGWIVQ